MNKQLIEWNDSYSIGYELIDQQHKKLVAMVNKMYEALLNGDAKDTTVQILGEMIDYTNYHFKTEEEIIDRHNYQDAEKHKNQHQYFIDQSIAFKSGLKAENFTVPYEVVKFLRSWLLEHIVSEDKKFIKFLNENK